jgi:hypothetical protein
MFSTFKPSHPCTARGGIVTLAWATALVVGLGACGETPRQGDLSARDKDLLEQAQFAVADGSCDESQLKPFCGKVALIDELLCGSCNLCCPDPEAELCAQMEQLNIAAQACELWGKCCADGAPAPAPEPEPAPEPAPEPEPAPAPVPEPAPAPVPEPAPAPTSGGSCSIVGDCPADQVCAIITTKVSTKRDDGYFRRDDSQTERAEQAVCLPRCDNTTSKWFAGGLPFFSTSPTYTGGDTTCAEDEVCRDGACVPDTVTTDSEKIYKGVDFPCDPDGEACDKLEFDDPERSDDFDRFSCNPDTKQCMGHYHTA